MFIHTELVDAGERFPFENDFLRGGTAAIVTPLSRVKIQICLIGEFVSKQEDISLLRSLWAQTGSFTNFQATYCNFDWSEERITVSAFCFFLSLQHVHILKVANFLFRRSSSTYSIARWLPWPNRCLPHNNSLSSSRTEVQID